MVPPQLAHKALVLQIVVERVARVGGEAHGHIGAVVVIVHLVRGVNDLQIAEITGLAVHRVDHDRGGGDQQGPVVLHQAQAVDALLLQLHQPVAVAQGVDPVVALAHRLAVFVQELAHAAGPVDDAGRLADRVLNGLGVRLALQGQSDGDAGLALFAAADRGPISGGAHGQRQNQQHGQTERYPFFHSRFLLSY